MSICGTLVTIALNATLLGQQGLTVSALHSDVASTTCTPDVAPVKANAVVTFKDAEGRRVYDQKIFVNDVDFMLTETKRSIAPLKEAMVFVSVPLSDQTNSIKTVQLEFLDGSFKRATRVKMPPLKQSVVSRGVST